MQRPAPRPFGKLVIGAVLQPGPRPREREKNTKAEAVSREHVPVHPTLAAMRWEWKLGGWPAIGGPRA